MATVPLSGRLISEIKANAVAPFDAIIKQVQETVGTDQQLIHMVRVFLSDEQQARTAVQLHAQNPLWMHENIYCMLVYQDASWTLNSTAANPLPLTSNVWKQVKIEVGKQPGIASRLDTLLIPFHRAVEDKKNLTATLDSIFEECKTLQHVAAVLPNVLDWISAEDKTRYNAAPPPKPAKRRSAEEIRADSLSDEAKQAMARARIVK